MKMIEMRMCQQNQIDRGKVFNLDSGHFEPLKEKQPIGKVRIDQNI